MVTDGGDDSLAASGLHRMELDEAGANPERIAAAIHNAIGDCPGPVPVHDIARTLDIVDIREQNLHGLEGALITSPERPDGLILVNRRSSRPRRRFTIAHELGHFLMVHHVMVEATGFRCRNRDMVAESPGRKTSSEDRHIRQEAEANRFAIELLAPRSRLRPLLNRLPDLARVLEISETFTISKEAAVRRYVELHTEPLAVLFLHRGRVIYLQKGNEFPWLAIGKGQTLPGHAETRPGLSDTYDADPADWFDRAGPLGLQVQVLGQEGDRAIVLLHADTSADPDDDPEPGDTFDRFTRDRG